MKSKLAPKLYYENICYVNITKPIVFHFFIHVTSFVAAILVKFYYVMSQFVPKLDAKSVVLEFTGRGIMSIADGSYWHSVFDTTVIL